MSVTINISRSLVRHLPHRLVLHRLALLLFFCAGTAGFSTPSQAKDPAFLAFGVGGYDVIDSEEAAVEFRGEYRSAQEYFYLKPFGGAMVTTNGAADVYAGVLLDIYWGTRIVTTFSFAPSLYYDGEGKDLGHVVEFRSQFEVAYRFDDRSRVGISINHLSNAGLNDRNPGTETIALTYIVPFDRVWNW